MTSKRSLEEYLLSMFSDKDLDELMEIDEEGKIVAEVNEKKEERLRAEKSEE